MRLSRGLLLVSAAFGALSVVAALSSAHEASLRCAAAMLAALAGYVAVAGKASAPAVRWGLTAGVGLLAAVMAARLFWYGERAAARDRLVAGRAIESTGAMVEQWRLTIDQERIAAVGLLLGLLCLAVALLALPDRHSASRGAATAIVALLLLVFVGRAVIRLSLAAPMDELVAATWPALLATVVAAGLLVVSGRRAASAWLLPIGALLVASATASIVDDLVGTWRTWWMWVHPRQDVFLSFAVRVSGNEGPQWSAAWEMAVVLAGPALLAVGALRRVAGDDPRADSGQSEMSSPY